MSEDDYHVLVVAPTSRHGWRKLETFCQSEIGGPWKVVSAPSMKPDLHRVARAITDPAATGPDSANTKIGAMAGRMLDELMRDMRRETSAVAESKGGGVRLSERADIPMPILTAVFDVLRAKGEHVVNVDDIKHVVSQQGLRITQLQELPAEQREHAQRAIDEEIWRAVLRSFRQAN